MSQPPASQPCEELAAWEYNLFGKGHAFALTSSARAQPSPPSPGAPVQVNQAGYIPAGLDQLQPDGEAELPSNALYTKDSEHLWSYGSTEHATPDQMRRLKDLLVSRKGTFAYSMKELPGYTGPPAEFTMVPGARAFCKQRVYSPLQEKVRDEKFTEQLEADIIVERDTRCDFAACPTMPAKKDENGNWTDIRMCVDYRFTNAQMCADAKVPMLPEQIFRSLKGAKVLSKMDMRSGFYQIPIHPDSQHVTAFWWGNKLYQYKRLSMGLKTACGIYQRIMERELELAGLSHCTKVFIDDLLIHSESMEQHLEHLAVVLDCLHAVGLRVHPAKSVFATDRVEYLGHMVTPDGLEPVAAKVAAMSQLPVPKNKEELRSALGLLNYYRCYIPKASEIAQPLNELLRKDAPFEWGPRQQEAYDALKAELCTPGKVLRHPKEDRQFIVHTDWSTVGIAAVLGQLDDQGNEFMVACISRSLNKHERQYEAWKGELLAAVWALKSFAVYLLCREFVLCTDHRPLLWLLTAQNPTGQQARWVLALQQFTYTIRHRPGETNVNADVPSRSPLPTTVDTTGARLDRESDAYTGPLPKVVFGPVGTGSPLQPYRLEDAPPELLRYSEAGSSTPSHLGRAPSHHLSGSELVANLARLSVITAGRYDQYLYHQQYTPDYLAGYDCRHLDIWETGCGDNVTAPTDQEAPADRIKQEVLRREATRWVQAAVSAAQGISTPAAASNSAGRYVGNPDQAGVRDTMALCTASVLSTYHTAATAGIVLLELFGGICAGLEMALRNGTPVYRYIYVDNDPACRAIAQHRTHQLMAQYPHLLPATAVEHAFDSLPPDVWQVTSTHLAALSSQLPRQWLVVGGWACEDLSPAGTCSGLQGNRSGTFYALLSIVGTLQQLQQRLPPAYLIENTAFQYNWKSKKVSKGDFKEACEALGEPICLDAAQFDSYAHRLRNYWTNLCEPRQLKAAASEATRSPNLCVQDILPHGRYASPVEEDDKPPFYCCNTVGSPLSAWPTIVAFRQSFNFLPGKPGAVWDANNNNWSEPTAAECEVAMGYAAGSTSAAGVTEQQRRAAMGRCMDANVMQSLYAISAAWFRLQHWAKAPIQLQIAIGESLPLPEGRVQGISSLMARSTHDVSKASIRQVILTSAAEASDQGQSPNKQSLDVWEDKQLLYYLREQQYQPGTSNEERTRVRKRAALYVLAVDGRLLRVLADGSKREVPAISKRAELIERYHEDCGHYGVRRTAALIQTSYWWHGMLADVALAVSKCKLCSRVRSSFNAVQPVLNPLPINGMFYRVGCDLAGPFNKTRLGSVYVMVLIEYHSKFLDVIPLPNKRAFTTAAAFAQHIIGRYGSVAEVVTDRGTEWDDEYEELLCRMLIDHRRTSAGHPQSDGLTERAVQTVKRALRKLTAQQGHKDDWDLMLPYLVLGYNCSPQKSTNLSPYMIMFARVPTVPPAIRERMTEPINFDDSEAATEDFLTRANMVKRLCTIAGDNLLIAQHRDTLRYAAVRSGKYLPKVRRFEVGDYVYVSRAPQTTLTIRARPLVLRVVEVRPSGVLVLIGRCGTTTAVHQENCAPCHLPDIDPRIDPTLAAVGEELRCEVCHSPDDEAYMVLCDNCNRGTHLYCASPPMDATPKGTWLCSDCLAQGFSAAQVEQRRSRELELEIQQQRPDDLTPSEQQAKKLHGRLATKTFTDPQTKLPRPFWGRVSFVGPGKGHNLLITYEDGDSETCTLRTMRSKGIKLMPEGTRLPNGVRMPDAAAATVVHQCLTISGPSTVSMLPASWDLSTRQGVATALGSLLPGKYAPSQHTTIAQGVKAMHLKGAERGWVPAARTALEPLARLVDFSGCHSFLDPFCGSGSIPAFFALMGFSAMLKNDVNTACFNADIHYDALQPEFYAAYPAQVIVTAPPAGVLDIAAPLVAAAASVVACILVPGNWVSSATQPRRDWFRKLSQQGRLHILMGLDQGPGSRKCAFLLVFATADMKRAMLRTTEQPLPLSFV